MKKINQKGLLKMSDEEIGHVLDVPPNDRLDEDAGSPDKYDLFIQRIDYFQSLVDEKKKFQLT